MLQPIPFLQLNLKIHQAFHKQWFLLTSGDYKKGTYNTMTISWGSMGVIWEKPFVQVVVRPVRYTFGFMEQFDTFTLCAFPKKYRKALSLLGEKSGRDGDKIALSGLSPIPSSVVDAPCFSEAELVIECRKIYWHDLDPAHFLDPSTKQEMYPAEDYHRAYFGEILAVMGCETYQG